MRRVRELQSACLWEHAAAGVIPRRGPATVYAPRKVRPALQPLPGRRLVIGRRIVVGARWRMREPLHFVLPFPFYGGAATGFNCAGTASAGE